MMDYYYYYHGPLNPPELDKARRVAARLGWRVEKSRKRIQDHNHQGGLMLLDEYNTVIDGEHYELTPQDVIRLCPKPRYVYKSTLYKRGRSDDLIAKYLGEPDKLVPNPHYRSGPRAKLYKLDRVIEVEEAGISQRFSEFLFVQALQGTTG